MAKQGTAKREAVRIEGAASAARPRVGRASAPAAMLRTLSAAALLMWVVATGTAAAQASPQPDPAPSPSQGAPSAPEISAPSITAPAAGDVITSTSSTVSGTKTPGSGVQLQNGDGEVLCIVDPSDSPTFSCSVRLGAGASVRIQAVATSADGSDADARSSVTVASIPPPTVLSGGSNPGNGFVRGTGIPGATVSVTATSGENCSSTADTSGAFACLLTGSAADGTYSVTATQVAPFAPSARSDASAAAPLILDRTAPLPPAFTNPRNGSSLPQMNAPFEGTGEDGATVTVFAGSASVCQAIVSDGTWSCIAARLPNGELQVVAIQRDTAGNTSSASGVVELNVGATPPSPAPASPTPSPHDAPSETPAPAQPAPGAPAPESQPERPTPLPDASPWRNGDAWDAATPFTTPRAPLFSSGSASEWAGTLLLGVLALTAIALVSHVTRRASDARSGITRAVRAEALSVRRAPRFMGRNRPDAVEHGQADRTPASPATIVAALVAVAGLLILSKPVDGTPAYARLLFASLTATFVVAFVSVAAPAVVSRLIGAGRVHTTVDPRAFVIVALTVAVSRVLGLETPLLFALVVTASTALAVRRAAEGRVAAARIVALTALGGASWALGSVLPALRSGGFASSLVTETLNVLTAASLGSAAIAMIPIGSSAGRSLWAASRPAWFGVGFVVVTVEIVLLGSRTPEATAAVTAIGSALAVACIVVSASVWIWRRHVAPILAEENAH